jgi:hypothetical protein
MRWMKQPVEWRRNTVALLVGEYLTHTPDNQRLDTSPDLESITF